MRTKLVSALLAVTLTVAAAPLLLAQGPQRTSTSYSIHSPAQKYNFAFVDGKGSITCWGNWDSSVFKDLNAKTKDETIYVKKDDGLYQITDKATIAAAKRAIEPMQKLGKQQGDLGRQQGELGRQQGDLGRKQGEYGRQMGQLARNEHSAGDMEALSRKMKDLGQQQSALGEKQKSLGEKQGELGQQQAAAAKEADAKISKLLDDAFARGLAKKV
jgi:hypothetical protein